MAHSPAPLTAGTRVRAVDFPASQFARSDAAINNISSTSYITGTPEVAVRFQAPTSGRVAVNVSCGLRNNSATVDRIFFAFRILVGDPADANVYQGEEVKYGLSNRASSDANDDFAYSGHLTIVDGLTPGEFYYAQTRYRVTVGGSTADLDYRAIAVFPIP